MVPVMKMWRWSIQQKMQKKQPQNQRRLFWGGQGLEDFGMDRKVVLIRIDLHIHLENSKSLWTSFGDSLEDPHVSFCIWRGLLEGEVHEVEHPVYAVAPSGAGFKNGMFLHCQFLPSFLHPLIVAFTALNIESKQASYVQYISARSKFLKSKPEEKLLCSPKSSSSLSLVYSFFFFVRKGDWKKKAT